MMRSFMLILFTLASFSFCIAKCSMTDTPITTHSNGANHNNDTTRTKMKISVGSAVFTATLNDNATVAALKEMLPLTISMSELNGNEKFYYLPGTLPGNASKGGDIQVGDLMLYGNNCLVLFYEGFNTSYTYTRIGRIENTSGLVDLLGTGNVTVKFELQ